MQLDIDSDKNSAKKKVREKELFPLFEAEVEVRCFMVYVRTYDIDIFLRSYLM
jgi:hypothetical protein